MIKLFSLLLFCLTCTWAQSPESRRAIELNERAVKLFQDSQGTSEAMKRGLVYLEEAIKIDSLTFIPYQTKVLYLRKLGRCKEALKTLDRLAAIHPEIIGSRSEGGYLLEKMGRRKQAMQRYQLDISGYDSVIARSTDSATVLYARAYRAFLIMLLNGKSKGIQEFKKIAQLYPDSDYLKVLGITFRDFDRGRFIKEQCMDLVQ